MANILKAQFESVVSTHRESNIILNSDPFFFAEAQADSPQQLTSIDISEEDIVSAINIIAHTGAAGPDGFNPQPLKRNNHTNI